MDQSLYLPILAASSAAIAVLVYLVFLRGRKGGSQKDRWFVDKDIARAKRPQAPISGTCDFCAERVSMPFRCKFCGKLHCGKHRIPESHECSGLPALKRL